MGWGHRLRCARGVLPHMLKELLSQAPVLLGRCQFGGVLATLEAG